MMVDSPTCGAMLQPYGGPLDGNEWVCDLEPDHAEILHRMLIRLPLAHQDDTILCVVQWEGRPDR